MGEYGVIVRFGIDGVVGRAGYGGVPGGVGDFDVFSIELLLENSCEICGLGGGGGGADFIVGLAVRIDGRGASGGLCIVVATDSVSLEGFASDDVVFLGMFGTVVLLLGSLYVLRFMVFVRTGTSP